MAARHSLNISITAELERFIGSCVRSGRYQTASEVVREALRLLQDQDRERTATFAALKGKLRRAAAQADRGEFSDASEVARRLDGIVQRERKNLRKGRHK